MKTLLFIYNPYAGKKELIGYAKLHTVIDYFTANGFLVTAYATQGKKDAYVQTKNLGKNFDYIVCAGGDGTLNEVTQGIVEMGKGKIPTVGYIPTGSTNDFSVGRGIPTKLTDALDVIVNGTAEEMDVGIFNESECFNYVAAFGLFTDVPYDTSQNLKNIFGHSAYVLEGVKRLTNITPIECRITNNNEVTYEDILLCIITNSESVGGFKMPQSSYYQAGKFHAIILKYSTNLLDYQGIAAVLMGLKEPTNQFVVLPVGQLEIASNQPIAWTLDGEYGGSHKENRIKINENSVKIMLPKK